MANSSGDTIVIDITTEYKDNTDSGLEKATKKADKFAESIDKAKKQVDSLKNDNATVDIKANDQATATIEKTKRTLKQLSSESGTVTLRAKDEASAAILKTKKILDELNGKTAKPTISLIDKASSMLNAVTEKVKSVSGKVFKFTVSIVDKATAPIRSILDYATSIKGIITGIFAALAANAVIANPVNMADTISTAMIGFETKLGSQNSAQDFMNQIEQFAIATPFSTNDLIGTSQQMLAMDWDPTTLISDLDKIGNAAAATGKGSEGVERITLALSQMRSKGKVSADEMLQLTEAGINAWQYLANTMGKTVPEVQAMSEKGLIPVETAISGIISGMSEFDGMMEKTANKTVSGLKSQIEDTFDTKLILKWGQGLQSGGITALSSINDWLGKNSEKIAEWGNKLEDIGSQMSAAAGKMAQEMLNGLDTAMNSKEFDNADLFGKVGIVWDDVISKPLEKWWASGGEARVQEIFNDVVTTISKVLEEGVQLAFKAAFSNGITGTIAVAYGLKTGLSLAKGLKDGIGAAGDIFSKIKEITGIGKAAAEGAEGISLLAKASGILGSALTALAGPIGLVIAAVGLAATGIAIYTQKQKEHREELSKLGDTYTDTVNTMDNAQKAYDQETASLKTNTGLISEYNDLKGQIASGDLSSDDQTAALSRQEVILTNLKELYPKAFGVGVSVEDGLANAQSMIDKEQIYQDLVLQRAKLDYSQMLIDISLKVPDIQSEMQKIQDELNGEHGYLETGVKLKATTDSFTTLQSDINQYNIQIGSGVDMSPLKEKILEEAKAMNSNNEFGPVFGADIVASITKSISNDTTLSQALADNVTSAQNSAIQALNDNASKIVNDQLQLSGYQQQLDLLSQGTDTLDKSTSNLGTNIAANQTTVNTVNDTASDTLDKTQQTDTAAKSASDNSKTVAENTQKANDDLDAVGGKVDTAVNKLSELKGAIGELDTSGITGQLEALTGTADTALEAIKSIVETKSTEAVAQAEAKFAELAPYVNGMTPQFYIIGQAMIQELIGGINSMQGDAETSVEDMVNLLVEKFKTGLGIHSPSTVLHSKAADYPSHN
ncbi:tape measure protein [Acetobacterium tundrae]|uniref:Tape measure protein n=1 Tax=Acetobacterium tundrae TaxID=132932 RepID=A0ABR6WNN6_9FIRM|nr:tape measure protein [Acetobacterium tundrae]MBC3798022.1 tape measure protein [Acetobacterium tundrae]